MLTNTPKFEILSGSENAVERGVKFMKNTKTRMDITFEKDDPSIVAQIPAYNEDYKDIIKRGAKIRCVTEVTPENILYCKKLLKMVTELL